MKIPPEEILLWAWVGVVFVFFSLARFKVDRYVYPAAPACCLLAARAWMSLSVRRPDLAAARDNVFVRWSVVALGAILVAVGIVAGLSLFDLGPRSSAGRAADSGQPCRRRVVLEATILRRRAVSPMVFGAVLVDAARRLQLCAGDRAAAAGTGTADRGDGRKSAAAARGRRSGGTVSPREMAIQPALLPRAPAQPAAGSVRRQGIPEQARAATS